MALEHMRRQGRHEQHTESAESKQGLVDRPPAHRIGVDIGAAVDAHCRAFGGGQFDERNRRQCDPITLAPNEQSLHRQAHRCGKFGEQAALTRRANIVQCDESAGVFLQLHLQRFGGRAHGKDLVPVVTHRRADLRRVAAEIVLTAHHPCGHAGQRAGRLPGVGAG